MSKVKLGIDNIDNYLYLFEGKRVGLITNTTGVNSTLVSTIDILAAKTNLTALFAPEHGVRGFVEAGEKIENEVDSKTGVPVYTLYGASKKPSEAMLQDVDILVFDIQDVGSRLYTYLYTMAYSMTSCKEYGKEFVVLDRPNPVGGLTVEGNIIRDGFTSFVGGYPIPYRYGLTMGEAATYINAEFDINADLTVIPMTGYQREMFYEDTGLVWVQPSPNMPTVDTAIVYNATCIFEGTNISEGRGTTKPFEIAGAPWIDAYELTDSMNRVNLPGVLFRPVFFTPTFSKHKGELCSGVQLHVTNRHTFKPVLTALHLLSKIKMQDQTKFEYLPPYTPTGKPMIDYNTGTDFIRLNEFDPDTVYADWQKEAAHFKVMKQKYHLYEEGKKDGHK